MNSPDPKWFARETARQVSLVPMLRETGDRSLLTCAQVGSHSGQCADWDHVALEEATGRSGHVRFRRLPAPESSNSRWCCRYEPGRTTGK
jgi:hypothetical protein